MLNSPKSLLRKLLPAFAILPLLFTLPACVPDVVNMGDSGQMGDGVRIISSKQYGVTWSIPTSIKGTLKRLNNGNMVIEAGEGSGAIVTPIFLDGNEPDEYAMCCAIIRSLGYTFPSHDIINRGITEENGQKWLHFSNYNPETERNVNFSITRNGNVLVGIVIVNFDELMLKGMTVPTEVWKYISFAQPDIAMDPASISAPAIEKHSEGLFFIASSFTERSRPTEAIPFIRTLRKLQPDNTFYATMLADTLIDTRDYENAEKEITELKELFPGNTDLVWMHAFTMGELGNKEEAKAEYRDAIFAKNNRSRGAINAYLSYLSYIEELGDYVDEVTSLVNSSGDPEMQYYLAKACIQSGDEDKARTIIDSIVDKCEAFPNLADPIVSIYLDLEDYERALEISKRIIAQNNPIGHYLAAATLLREGRFNEAKEEVIICIEKMPLNQNAKNLLEGINAQLGKADSSSFQAVIEPVPLPKDFKELTPLDSKDIDEGFGCHYVYRGKVYSYKKGERMRSTIYGKFQVNTPEAIRDMSDLRFPFDPLYEHVYVNALNVYDANGEKIDSGELSDYYTANDPDEVLMSQKKELHLPVPSLTPGCYVEYTVSLETLGKRDDMPFQHEILSRNKPALLTFTGISGEIEHVSTVTANGVVEQIYDSETPYRFFYATNPVTTRYCPNLPPMRDYAPTVWISDKSGNWADEVKDYYETVSFLDEEVPEVNAKVAELLGEEYTPEHAIRTITNFVRTSLTYQGLEFGMRAMVPNRCDNILRNRYGDCKDHSFLLMKMLRAAGVNAELALVDTSSNINVEVPDSGQFDHMIVFLPDYKDGFFIDTTNKDLSEIYEPISLAGSPCLILDNDNPRIETIDAAPFGINGFDMLRTVELSENGAAIITEKVSFSGVWAAMIRSYLRNKTPDEYATYILPSLNVDGLSSVKKMSATNVDELDEKVILEYSYASEGVFTQVGDTLVGSMPQTWERWELNLPNDLPERKLPIFQRYHAKFTSSNTLRLPEGYSASNSSELEAKLDSKFITLGVDTRFEDGVFSMKEDYARKDGCFEAEERDLRERAYIDAMLALTKPIILVKDADDGKTASK